jgi:hypothetical protein
VSCVWPRHAPELASRADQGFTALGQVCQRLVGHVWASVRRRDGDNSRAAEGEGGADEPALTLGESPSQPPRSGFSMSNLTLFRYYSPASAPPPLPCPAHTDIGLVTIIPIGRGAPSLFVHDMAEGRWVDVERGAPADGAIIFAGELLTRLTNGRFQPAFHEVVRPRGPTYPPVPSPRRSDLIVCWCLSGCPCSGSGASPLVPIPVPGACRGRAGLCGLGPRCGGALCAAERGAGPGRPLRLRAQPHPTEHHLQCQAHHIAKSCLMHQVGAPASQPASQASRKIDTTRSLPRYLSCSLCGRAAAARGAPCLAASSLVRRFAPPLSQLSARQ